MARLFTRGGGDKLQVNSAVLTAMPLTIACWFNATALDNAHRMVSLTDGSTNNRFQVGISVGNAVLALIASGGSSANATSSATITAGTWFHCAAVFASATSRTVYLNGGNSGTNATNLTPSGLNVTVLGNDGTTTCNGTIAWPAIWNAALSNGEIAALATGLDPRLLQSQRPALKFFALLPGASPEVDVIGGLSMTVTNATRADDPINLVNRSARRGIPGREINPT